MTVLLEHPGDARTDSGHMKVARLRIRALGACVITAGRSRIKPDSAVLFALALNLGVRAGERVTRADVLELLWPGVAPTARRHALRQLVYRLKRSGVPLDGEGDELSLDPGAVECDITALLRDSWAADVAIGDIPSVNAVLPSYQPDVTDAFHAWVDELRGRCAAQIRRAALRHVASARREGRWADLERMARLCIESDPLNEEATLALAEAFVMSGSKAEALRLLDAYLWELGDRDKSIGLPARLLRRRISEQPVYRAPRAGEPPLIARSDDIAWLNTKLDETAVGRCGTAMLVGPPGIGKTAVMRTFVSHAEMRGWRFIESRLQPSDVDRPMSVFVELLPPLLKASGALGASPESLAQLRRLIEYHVVDDILANKSQEAEAVQARIRESIVDLLDAITHEGPLVLVLEDLHWLDKQSLRLLAWLLEHATDAPVLWLLTARMEGRFEELRDTLPAERVPSRTIEPLGRPDAMLLFRACGRDAPQDADRPLPAHAYDVTGGNPLFIREVAGHWAETGGSEGLPGNLKALMRGRVARLGAAAQRVLHCCAVLGRFASVPRVSVVLEISTTELLACIEEVDGLGLLGLGGEPGSLALHDLWQEELIGTLRPASRALLHLRCGEVLASESAESKSASMVSEAARHLIAAGVKDRALRLLEDAAVYQLANGLSEDAVGTCQLALANTATPEERSRIVPVLVEALQQVGNWHETLRVCTEHGGLAGIGGTQANMELARLEALWRTGQDVDSCLEGALRWAEDSMALPQWRLKACLIAARCGSNQFNLSAMSRVQAAFKTLKDIAPPDYGIALATDLLLECELGSLDAALERADALVSHERSNGSVVALARALRFAAYASRATGDFRRSLRLTAEAYEVAAGCQLAEHASQGCDSCATLCLEQNDLDGCDEWLVRAEHWAKKISPQYAQRSLCLVRANLCLRRGKIDEARRLLSYDRMSDSPSSIREHLAILEVQCRILCATGDTAALLPAATDLESVLLSTRERPFQDSYVGALVQSLSTLGRASEASAYANTYAGQWRRCSSPLPPELALHVSA